MSQESETSGEESPAEIEREIARTRARLGSTLDAIEDRLSPEHLMEQGMAYLREEAGEWGGELGDFVRRNPLPVAVLGLGIGLVVYSAVRSNRQDDWDDDFGAGPEGLYGPGYMDDLGSGPGEQEGGQRSAIMERASGVGSRISSTLAGGASQARHLTDEAANRLSELRDRASELAEGAREFAESTRERLTGAAADTRDRANRAMEATRAGVERVQHEVVRTAEERPLLLGLFGLGAGVLIGLCLPATRAEIRALGRRRDELLEGARQIGTERLQGVVEAVRHAGETALEQAKGEGLSREGISNALGKVQRVAETVLDTAKETAETRILGGEASGKPGEQSGTTGQGSGPKAGGASGKTAEASGASDKPSEASGKAGDQKAGQQANQGSPGSQAQNQGSSKPQAQSASTGGSGSQPENKGSGTGTGSGTPTI